MTRAFIAAIFAVVSLSVSPAVQAVDPASIGAVQNQDEIWVQFDEKVGEAKKAMMGAPDEALVLADEAALLIAVLPATTRQKDGIATTLWLKAEALNRSNRAEEAAPLIEEALDLIGVQETPTKLKGDLLLVQARVAQALGDVQGALEGYLNAHEIFEGAGVARSQTIALLKVGDIYNDAQNYERAINYYRQAAEAFTEDPSLSMVNHNNLGNALRGQGDYKAAEENYRKALEVAEGFGSPMLNARILTNIASAQLLDGQLDDALATAERGLAQTTAEQASGWEPFLWGVKAQVAFRKGQTLTAADHIARTFEGMDLSSTPMPFRDFHEAASDIYRETGQTDLALQHLAAFKRLDDEAISVAASANSALMAAQFDFANQELRIEQLRTGQLERDIALAKARERQRMIVFVGAAGVGLIVLIFLGIGYVGMRRSRNQIQAANEELNVTNIALEKANNAKTEFLATTSHEIRTPLNGILGMTQAVLADRTLDTALRERLEVVKSAGNAMKAIVDDILDVSKIETGKVTLDLQETNLEQVFGEVARLWQDNAESSGLSYTVDLTACPKAAMADEKRVRQIAFNLLSNAVKFTETGHVKVWSELENRDGQSVLRFQVEDTGIGIPEDEFENIFKSFHQVDGSKSRKFAGTGLGLAICRNLSRAMGGDVMVQSEVEKGSTFTFEFPVEVLASDDDIDGDRPAPSSLEEVHVVVYEPNMINQFMIQSDLEDDVERVVVVGEDDELLEALETSTFDVVVTDTECLDSVLASRTTVTRAFRVICCQEDIDPSSVQGADAVVAGELDGDALLEAMTAFFRDAAKDDGPMDGVQKIA